MPVVPRRPTRLETPPPGCRCPACWHLLVLEPRQVSICPRCYVIVTCSAPEVVHRLVQADLLRLTVADRMRLCTDRAHMISVGALAWRTAPRPQALPRGFLRR